MIQQVATPEIDDVKMDHTSRGVSVNWPHVKNCTQDLHSISISGMAEIFSLRFSVNQKQIEPEEKTLQWLPGCQSLCT